MTKIEHGRSGYSAGCRCDVCKAGIRLWREDRAARIRAGEAEPSQHGTTGFSEGCRCDVCVTESRAYHREYTKVRKPTQERRGLSVRLKLSRTTLDAVDAMAERAGTDQLTELHRIIDDATRVDRPTT